MYWSCDSSKESHSNSVTESIANLDPIVGLASTIQLEGNETTVFLSDYFLNVDQIDSIDSEDQFFIIWNKGDDQIKIRHSEGLKPMTPISFWSNGSSYQILTKPSRKQTVTLTFDPGATSVKKVQLVGDMNGWNDNDSDALFENVNGIWVLERTYTPGKYSYQFILDGKRALDPTNPVIVSNGMGSFNSLLEVNQPLEKGNVWLADYDSSTQNLIIETSVNAHDEWDIRALWQNQLTNFEHGTGTSNHFKVKIPAEAKSMERSYMRIIAYTDFNTTNDLLVPLAHGNPVMSTKQLTRKDKHTNSLYFALVDRFNDGDTSINEPIKDDRVDFKANYQGGDILGITNKINEGYFEELGFNSVWLSPITQNPLEAYQEYPEPRKFYSGYHGYWPISYKKVDHRFGGNSAFKNLVETAHSKDLNVILDYASNHVHELHPMYQAHPDWGTELDLPDGSKNIRIWDAQRLTTWFDTFLPSLDFSRPEIIEAVSDSAMFWVNEYDIDGFRHDATKHIPETYWRELTRKVKTKKGSDLFQIGETFGSRELIGSYVNSGQQNGQFDFNLYFDARSVLIEESQSFERLNASLYESFDYYGWHSLMGNITGNHDMPRFISYAGKGLSFNEDPQKAGWDKTIKVEDPVGYNKLSLLHAFITTIPGIPVVYYGDEIGMAGAGDPDNRRMMRFNNLNKYEIKTQNTLKTLMSIRNNNMALIYGDFKTASIDEDTWVYSRTYLNNQVTVYLNKSNKTKTFNTADNQKQQPNFDGEISDGKLIVPANSFEILILNSGTVN